MEKGEEILNHVDRNLDSHIERLRDYLRQESISLVEGHNDNVDTCARYLCKTIESIGGETELCEFEDGYPVVVGRFLSGNPNAKTLVFYSLYDAMPVDEPEWKVDPFAAEILDAEEIGLPIDLGKCIVARCARNQKGPTMGFLNAIDSILKINRQLPVNVILNIEGEEELGSPHMSEFRDRYLKQLKKADAVWYGNPAIDETGHHILYGGARGLIALTLKVMGGDWGGPTERSLFAPEAAWIDEPVWHLIKALNILKDLDGRVLVDGFYDDVAPPTEDEARFIKEATDAIEENSLKKKLGIKRFKRGKPAEELLPKYIMDPLLNIDGIQGGYTGPFIKTNLPHIAKAKMDIRLVPNMRPEDIIEKMRNYLDKNGFPHVEIDVQSKYGWSYTSSKADVVKAAIKAAERLGYQSIYWPRYYACCPLSVYTGPPLNLPAISAGLGHMGRLHEANEYITIEGLRLFEKYTVSLLDEFAQI